MRVDLQKSATTDGLTGLLERVAPGLSDAAPPSNRRWQRRRWTVVGVAIGLLAILLTLIGVTTSRSAGGALDPRSAGENGSRALAQLLQARGIAVSRGTNAGPGTTVLVPFPEALTDRATRELLTSGADVVLIAPGGLTDLQLSVDGSISVRTRSPGCDLAPALVAGASRLGGFQYSSANTAVSCYDGALLALPAGTLPGSGKITVVGSPDLLTNKRLDQQGNAALAIGLLSERPKLTWFTARRTSSGASLTDLLPKAIPWALLQLGIALVVVAAWRGRRLGPVVTEPLPVVVRAAETVLGRARLYAAAHARSTAAEAIRAGSRARLAALVHLDPAAPPEALITSVASRAGGEPAAIAALLYASGGYRPPGAGAGPSESDVALVGLADELDRLEKHVREGSHR